MKSVEFWSGYTLRCWGLDFFSLYWSWCWDCSFSHSRNRRMGKGWLRARVWMWCVALVAGTIAGTITSTAMIMVIVLNSIGSGTRLNVQIGRPAISKDLSEPLWRYECRAWDKLDTSSFLFDSYVDRFASSWHGRVIEMISLPLHHRFSIQVTNLYYSVVL